MKPGKYTHTTEIHQDNKAQTFSNTRHQILTVSDLPDTLTVQPSVGIQRQVKDQQVKSSSSP